MFLTSCHDLFKLVNAKMMSINYIYKTGTRFICFFGGKYCTKAGGYSSHLVLHRVCVPYALRKLCEQPSYQSHMSIQYGFSWIYNVPKAQESFVRWIFDFLLSRWKSHLPIYIPSILSRAYSGAEKARWCVVAEAEARKPYSDREKGKVNVLVLQVFGVDFSMRCR